MAETRHRAGRDRAGSDLAGAVADLGVMVPLSAAMIVTNGLDGTAVFVSAGLLVGVSGVYFRIPFPVQPLKALAAVAIARELGGGVIAAAGLEIAAFLFLLALTGTADRIARVFTLPVVRALQAGVGLLLVLTAYRMLREPPAMFAGTPSDPWPFVGGAVALVTVWWAVRTRRYGLSVVLLVSGCALGWLAAAPTIGAPRPMMPTLVVPTPADFGTAFVLLVIGQLPLTFGNAVVAVTDVARSSFGERAARVTPAAVCISCGAGNALAAAIGGTPMCHGAGGLTAHVRLGATTRRMNVGLGCAFIAIGVLYGSRAPEVLGLLPVWVLAAFLAYAGVRHAMLAAGLGRARLIGALGAGAAGAIAGNLAVTLAVALVVDLAGRGALRTQRRVTRTA